MSADESRLRETPLAAWHRDHGGRMVPFGGWSMPVQYGSIVEEHRATRSHCGLFDVSHMGRLTVAGAGARDWLESTLTRSVAGLSAGRARYTLVTDEGGPRGLRVLDDALVACEGDTLFQLVVNAANRERVVESLAARLPANASLEDRTGQTAMIAVQGPQAVGIVAGLCEPRQREAITAMPVYRTGRAELAGVDAAVSRTGYTGEDGFELVVDADCATRVWEALVSAGGRPCGLGARDTLRLEAGMPLYGHELVESSDPFAVGLGFAVNLEGREFPGRKTLAELSATARATRWSPRPLPRPGRSGSSPAAASPPASRPRWRWRCSTCRGPMPAAKWPSRSVAAVSRPGSSLSPSTAGKPERLRRDCGILPATVGLDRLPCCHAATRSRGRIRR